MTNQRAGVSDMERMARSLTEAQRRAIADPLNEFQPPMWLKVQLPKLIAYNEGAFTGKPRTYWTPLGLALRAHLLENDDGE